MVVYYTSHLVVKRVIDQVQPSSVLPPSVACGFQFVWLRVGNLIIRNAFARALLYGVRHSPFFYHIILLVLQKPTL